MEERIKVLENGTELSYSFEDMLRYHGTGYPGGVAHAFKVMQRAFPLLDQGKLLERREISVITAFPGPGGRDGFEMVTRCLTDNRFFADKHLPEGFNELQSPGGRYYFRLNYRGTSVAVTIRPGFVRDDFIQMARKKNRTQEEDQILAEMKLDMAHRLMAASAKETYDGVILRF